jgi:hypothetical protein
VAARAGVGRTVLLSSGIWRNHPEKCLAVRAAWAELRPDRLQALLGALLRAGRACDDPARAAALAAVLADPSRVGVPTGLIGPPPVGDIGAAVDRSVFAAHAAAFPWRSHARWFAGQMARWRPLPPDAAARAERLYRPELYAEAARATGRPVPLADRKAEGGHEGAWELPASPAAVPMLPDVFCDGRRFEP